MKKLITTALAGGAVAVALLGAGTASADYSWVPDKSAEICNALSLTNDGYDWMSIQISSLQLTQHVGRAEAVTGIRQAANGYCPQYVSAVPAR